MIPEFAIREWGEQVPWTETEQVEQDLLICRALTEIYTDPYLASHLAFRGGTALHKLFLSPQPRYSEDIDLVQVKAEPIKETYDRIREALSFLGEPKVKQKKHNNTLIFRLESEAIPVVPIHLKVEINCKEHFNVLPMMEVPFLFQTNGITENVMYLHINWMNWWEQSYEPCTKDERDGIYMTCIKH